MPSVLGYLRWVASVTADAPLSCFHCVRWREFCVVSAPGAPRSRVSFWRCRTTLFFWASKFADWGPAASRAPGRTTDNPMGRCALRRAILCPIYFNQHVSALLAESLHPPCLSRNRSTLQIAAHDGSPASWSSPWREHGHSDVASIERQNRCQFGNYAKRDRSPRLGLRLSLF